MMSFLISLDDASRLVLMTLITSAIGLGTAFGLNWTAEQVGAITAFATAFINVVMYLSRPKSLIH